jgi:hypothetical protein
MSAQVASILRKARANIVDITKWCKGIEDGKVCALNAVYAPSGAQLLGMQEELATRALDLAATQMYPKSSGAVCGLRPAAYVNDKYGHAAALRMYDIAIYNEEGLL